MMRTPPFWYRDPAHSPVPWAEKILSAVSPIYSAADRVIKQNARPYKSKTPVVCVGNIVAGGSGKTPTLLALHSIMLKHALASDPAFLSRGYGGSIKGAHRVSLDHDTAQQVGDEPLLLAKRGKTVVSKNRLGGVKEAQAWSADLILMDDGFQNFSIEKTISFVVIDGAAGFGNRKILPAGPLREPIAEGLSRADAIILIGADERGVAADIPPFKPVFSARIIPEFSPKHDQAYFAFCGLGRPEKFKDTLKSLNLTLTGFESFADHHPYTAAEIEGLIHRARGATLLTTEKDFVRLPQGFKQHVKTVPITLHFTEEQALADFLKTHLSRPAS